MLRRAHYLAFFGCLEQILISMGRFTDVLRYYLSAMQSTRVNHITNISNHVASGAFFHLEFVIFVEN